MIQMVVPSEVRITSRKDVFIETLKSTCGLENEPELSFNSVSFCLHKISHLPYNQALVEKALEESLLLCGDFTPFSLTEKFVDVYPKLFVDQNIEQEIKRALEEDRDEICYQFSTFCSHTLPINKTDKTELITEYPNNKMTISCPKGIPFGGIARIIVLYVNSIAVKYRSKQITLGKSIRDFVTTLGYAPTYVKDGTNDQVLSQLEKLFFTTWFNERTIKTQCADGNSIVENQNSRFHIFDGTITFEEVVSDLSMNASAMVVLSDNYFDEILKHPVPLSLEAIRKLKKSPLALDLYCFIAYRANSNKLIPIKYVDLQKQFGSSSSTWRFKEQLQRAGDLVQKVWPEAKPIFKDKVMILPKMNTHISAL